jgi:hypothetical protein
MTIHICRLACTQEPGFGQEESDEKGKEKQTRTRVRGWTDRRVTSRVPSAITQARTTQKGYSSVYMHRQLSSVQEMKHDDLIRYQTCEAKTMGQESNADEAGAAKRQHAVIMCAADDSKRCEMR